MTFEYTDPDGDELIIRRAVRKTPQGTDEHFVAFGALRVTGPSVTVHVPLDRVEEVIVGIRDAARTAAARQTTPHACDNCDGIDPASCLANPDRAARQTTGQDACACTHPQDRHLSACTECPCIGYAPTWPPKATGSEGPDPCSVCPTFPCRKCAPAVGQPAEAQPADEARPPRERWTVEGYDADEWNPVSRTFSSSQDAHARKRVSQRYPDMPTRVVRETTTWTVEDER